MTVNTFDKNGIKFTEVINDNGFKVIFSNLGASIYLVRYDKYVFNRNVRNIEDFKITNQYYGKTIGRTSNRLKGHKFRIGEKIFDVEPNEGNNILHGGKYGLSCSYFTVHTTSLLDKTIVSYETTLSNDGYPGELFVKVTYSVSNDDDILINYEATSSEDTLCSLTNHAYWTLGSKDISGLKLQISASKYLKTDPNSLLPISEEEVTETLDFRKEKIISRDLDSEELHAPRLNGYDHYYYFDKNDDSLKATLRNNKFKMEVYTDFPGLQIYTHGYDNGKELFPDSDNLFNSVAIEPSESFMKLHVLKKDSVYSHYIRYIFVSEK